MGDTQALTVPRGDEMCPRCDEPIGLHNGVKAIDCLIKLAHSAEPRWYCNLCLVGGFTKDEIAEHRAAAHGG